MSTLRELWCIFCRASAEKVEDNERNFLAWARLRFREWKKEEFNGRAAALNSVAMAEFELWVANWIRAFFTPWSPRCIGR